MASDERVTERRRRIFLIDREFQYWYMTSWILMTLAFIGVILLVAHWSQAAVKIEDLRFLLKRTGWFVILLTVFMGCLFLLMAHRIAGPAYRLRKCLERVARGDLDFDVVLRKRDYLKDVADGMNAAIRRMRERRDRTAAARDAWRRVSAAVSATPEGRQAAAEIEAAFDDALRVEPAGEETKAVLVSEPGGHA
jgi:methyl-accepting chemotaxis protein